MRNLLIISILASLFGLLTFCTKKHGAEEAASPWLNQNDTARYVGMETCKLCHGAKYESFIHTGMGMSFDHATRMKSAAEFGPHAIVYDSINNFYYKPFWQNDSLMITEFRLEDGDTTYRRTEKVSYIIGSGQHTNSHLVDFNGYVYQAPITFYTQRKQWDLAPGMNGGYNSRFTRIITSECMNCHNGFPTLVSGSVNKYAEIPTGIDCERCHGPGSLHVERISRGIIVDTSKETDYSIVNPKNLPVALQNQLCMRCHLQGVDVLNPGAGYFDFKPGDSIADHWNIFLPRFDGRNDKFLMASQADRLMQSRCFIESQNISCITCHNPHIDVRETPVAQFNNACIGCHTAPAQTCTEKPEVRALQNDNCSGCHIPKSGSVDIPHVSISDHKIQIPGKEKEKPNGQFTGLKCMTEAHPSALTMAEGYLVYYESFNPDAVLLDSAAYFIALTKQRDAEYKRTLMHYDYLKKDFAALLETAGDVASGDLDAWSAYRAGEACLQVQDFAQAVDYFHDAVQRLPYDLDFNYKLAVAYLANRDTAQARHTLQFILAQNPEYEDAWVSLALLDASVVRLQDAVADLEKALDLDPDDYLARLNLANLYIRTRQRTKAREAVAYLQKHYPGDAQVKALAAQIRAI